MIPTDDVQHLQTTDDMWEVYGDSNGVIYTYDLPDRTEYKLIDGKRFKEYEIPVKNESIAYGPNLDELEVLLIPFSHVDPGYGMTMEAYYRSRTKKTLDAMVTTLHQYKDMTFQWAETVFLERWWKDIKPDTKDLVRALIQDGRLEILSGGWVMPDEAITHYSPVIDQLIEGHQWLWENLGIKPKNNWANDPFGYSSTFPYIWKKSGIENMVILRIHQAIKGTLMKEEALEFVWKPLWSKKHSNDILCHLMPYRGYWIGDTCGPYNQHICREYAFMHTEPVHKVVFVTEENLAERARILYEQYRITAELYRRNSLNKSGKPVPQKIHLAMFLGEDFSYDNEKDFDLIHEHYHKLFTYINAKTEWKTKLKFGTVQEYFTKIRAQQEKRSGSDGSRFPVLSGDFFPYSDYQNDYWTGYFTTRPFNKQFSREVHSVLKMADIFHVYAHTYAKRENIRYGFYADVTSSLRTARRDLGMFLHHDGITGTSVISVIQDFQYRLFNALENAKKSIKMITAQLLTRNKFRDFQNIFQDTSKRDGGRSLPVDITFDVSTNFMQGGSLVIVTNPTPRSRTDIVSLQVISKEKYIFVSSDSKPVEFQADTLAQNVSHRISFVVELPPFGIQTYLLEAFTTKKVKNLAYEEDRMTPKSMVSTETSLKPTSGPMVLENDFIRVEVDHISGFPTRIRLKNDENTEVSIQTEVLAYTSKRSGAYIFAPNGGAAEFLSGKPKVSLLKGKLLSQVKAEYFGFSLMTTVYHIDGIKAKGVHIKTELDMSKNRQLSINKEVILRLKTSVNNGDSFFTDQNGFQLLGRKTRRGRLIEENYYPITTMMVIEDEEKRLALHVGQPHGVASLQNGWMEVMLDRMLSRDDGKGLGQGVSDNVLTRATFILQLEQRKLLKLRVENPKITFQTEANTLMNEILNEPVYTLFADGAKKFREEGLSAETLKFNPLPKPLPCDTVIVGLRNLAMNDLKYNGTSLVLHKVPSHSDFERSTECKSVGSEVTLDMLFKDLKINRAAETSLTHLYNVSEVSLEQNLVPDNMELRTFLLDF